VTNPGEGRPTFGAALTELSSARVPWLALARDPRPWCDATVIDLADPHVPPVTVNPFEPEAGYPVQAHAGRLAGLLEAAFGLPDPVAAAVRAGLWQAYADCGWDAVTGTAPPGARTAPAVPSFGQLARATVAAAAELGYDRRLRAAVRGFVRARLAPLWAGPAGRFLEGGHPADVGCLVQGRVLICVGGVADDEGTFFLTAALLARIADRLRAQDRRDPARGRAGQACMSPPGPQLAVVTAADLIPAATRPRAAVRLGRLHDDLRAAGAAVIVAMEPRGPEQPRCPDELCGAEDLRGSEQARAVGAGAGSVLRGRRSAACGVRCRDGQPCTGYELHAASLLARDDERAWLRLWTQTLLLAFLTGRPLPALPAEVRSCWRALSPRSRECVLATVLDHAVTARAAALRLSYDPAGLTSVVAAVAGRLLDEGGAPFRVGLAWVIPQLRWLHEAERLNPLGGSAMAPDDIAPPLDFGLAGLLDWPGIRVRDRLSALRRHPLSMAAPRNRRLAGLALFGEDGRAGLDADLAAAVLGVHPAARLPYAARLMGADAPGPAPGWLEVVLSWPDRMIRPSWDTDLHPAPDLRSAADPDPRPVATG
jgi:uncharacterized protein